MSSTERSVVKVPMGDLHLQYLNLKSEIDAAIADVIEKSAFIRGPAVDHFEAAFASAVEADHCISCANGTDALYIAMVALGVKPGDEVIVPAMSWVSTSETVTQAGGRVVFCDIDPVTYTLDPSKLADVITPRTVGIIPVHLYGHPAQMDEIMAIANEHGFWVIEDSAQAHLAEFKGQKIGNFGRVATFSFYPGKNLGAMGDAGAIVTNDAALGQMMTKFARHGGIKKGDHEIEGINSRMDGLQAAVLDVKLKHLVSWTERRRTLAAAYSQALSDLNWLTLPVVDANANPAWHLYVVQTDKRDALAAHLKTAGIQTSVNYPRALHQLPCYAHMEHEADAFPIAAKLAEQGLALPLYAEMTDVQLERVIESIRSFDVSSQ